MKKPVTSKTFPEIVAPAGDMECFSAALNATADENIPVTKSDAGEIIGIATPSPVREGDKVYVLVPRDGKYKSQ